jgi:3'-5' exonuclease
MKQFTPLSQLLLIDIETIPQAASFDALDNNWKELWTHKASRIYGNTLAPEASYPERAAILAEFGQVVCIVTAFFFKDPAKGRCLKIKAITGTDEKKLLETFTSTINRFQTCQPGFRFAGHNIQEFDIPYLCRRLLIHSLPLADYLPLHGLKPWEYKMLDTMQWWRFGDFKNYISLELLAACLQLPSPKTDMNGAMVKEVYYRDQDLPRIARYCRQDVITLAQVILRYYNLPLLEEANIVLGD